MRDGDVGRLLASVSLPGELEARRRSWRVVRAAFDTRERIEPEPRSFRRPALALAALGAALAAVVTPPGRAVIDSVRDAIGEERVVGVREAKPGLFSLPAEGRLLVTSARGAWIVEPDGSRRLLGRYREATWSPQGRFVAATTRHELLALEPDGDIRWTLARRNVSAPAWAPSGLLVAYVSDRSLRVVEGNSEGDRGLVPRVARVRPAWKPDPDAHVLAYAAPDGAIRLLDVNANKVLAGWRARTPQQLAWSADGALVATRSAAEILIHRAPDGLLQRRLSAPPREAGRTKRGAVVGDRVFVDTAFAPRGQRLAALVHDPTQKLSRVVVYALDGRAREGVAVFEGRGRMTDLEWSPDGRWLLVAWESADQWVLGQPVEGGFAKLVARSSITKQLNRGAVDAPFPSVAGWCCGRAAP